MNLFLKNKKVFSILLILLTTSVWVAFKFSVKPSSLPAGIGKVQREDLAQRVTIAGVVVPNRRTLITAPYPGYIKKLFVHTGDHVKLGAPLVSIAQSLQSQEPTFPLRSPLSGTVVQVRKEEGEFTRETDTKDFILRIDDLSRLYILADAPEIDRAKIKTGQEAIIKAAAILSKTYKGVLRELALAAKEREEWGRNSAVEFPVKVEITDADAQLQPGMSTVIDIVVSKKENILTLRHEYIQKEREQYFVHLKNGERREIQVGMWNEEAFEITTGLKEGDLVRQVDFASQTEEL